MTPNILRSFEAVRGAQPFLLFQDEVWHEVKDGNISAYMLYQNHYSRHRYRDGRDPSLICGPGYKLVLLTPDANALFVWRKFIDKSGQTGINCAVFRNESARQASNLIRAADEITFTRWPGERHYTLC